MTVFQSLIIALTSLLILGILWQAARYVHARVREARARELEALTPPRLLVAQHDAISEVITELEANAVARDVIRPGLQEDLMKVHQDSANTVRSLTRRGRKYLA